MVVLGALRPARLRARDLAAGAAMTAALIHLEVVPEHLREWKLEGAFFAALAAAQALLALLLLRGRATIRTLLTGIFGTVGVGRGVSTAPPKCSVVSGTACLSCRAPRSPGTSRASACSISAAWLP